MEENNGTLSDLMCVMLDAVCDDEPTETTSVDIKLIEETNDQKIISSLQNGLNRNKSNGNFCCCYE